MSRLHFAIPDDNGIRPPGWGMLLLLAAPGYSQL